MRDRWRGGTVVCIASGPSLTAGDIAAVREWRKAQTGSAPKGVIVANTSYQAALWADALFAMDYTWWQRYLPDVKARFQGQRFSTSPVPDVQQLITPFKGYGNSGAACVALAAFGAAQRVIMLGYDCQKTGGKAHWHGDHPKELANAKQIDRWPERFVELAKDLDIGVLNASRETALDMFKRVTLDDVLGRH